jgi:UDP:flavonoid glycosyltransferase YjiC (YdhE family)
LIITSAFDQFFNGHRIETLKLGVWCKSKDVSQKQIEEKLRQAIFLPKSRLALYQEMLAITKTIEFSCNELEKLNSKDYKTIVSLK